MLVSLNTRRTMLPILHSKVCSCLVFGVMKLLAFVLELDAIVDFS